MPFNAKFLKMSNKLEILRLYKDLLKESSSFKSYYYKNYFTRKTKSLFRKHINADEETSNKLVEKSRAMLAMMKRQTVITNIYDESRLVIEDTGTDTNQKKELEANKNN